MFLAMEVPNEVQNLDISNNVLKALFDQYKDIFKELQGLPPLRAFDLAITLSQENARVNI